MRDEAASGHDAPLIGQILLEEGWISRVDLDEALEQQRRTGERLGEILVARGVLDSVRLTRALAQRKGHEFLELADAPRGLEDALPEAIARRYQVLAVAHRGDALVVAMVDPDDVVALDDLRLRAPGGIVTVMADPEQLAQAIDRTYDRSAVHASLTAATTSLASVAGDDAPVVRLVDALLEEAVRERASDIHVEPGPDDVTIRFRIDGVLHDVRTVPLSLLAQVVSRVKVLAGADIAQSRIPQEGRFALARRGLELDVRVATAPTAFGEAVVLRLLDHTRGIIDLEHLGFTDSQLVRYEQAYRSSQGAIVVTGPTGSGKTATVYATVQRVNTRERNVMGIEDPIEYKVPGLKQLQVDPRLGLTFPAALRSILRCDPDVIVVGEVRDGETASIAARAAMTGHLVLTTLHTTSAASAPARLVEMGVEPYVVSSALACVVAQRLARRLCDHCAQPVEVNRALLRHVADEDGQWEGARLRRPVGCPRCAGTGYRGRVALFEVLSVTDEIRRLVLDRAPVDDIDRCAREDGMETLRRAGFHHVLAGVIGIDELMRLTA